MPDSLLLSRARRGDQDAVAELYRDHVGAALKYARAIAPSVVDAEDLVAEAFTRVIAQLALDRGPDSSFRAYLFTTMRHRLYSTNRREYAVADDSVLDRPTEDRADEDRADHAPLKQAFDSLAKQEQEVLLLLDVQELRPAEVCDRLGLRASALSMRVARARSALAEAYLVAHVRPAEPEECQATRQQLGRHVRGRLSALRSRRVSAHLSQCAPCGEALAEVTKVNRSLRALPVFWLPTATPRGWRTALHALRSSHVGAAPTAAKIAVVAAAITAGSSAAVVLASKDHHATPGQTHIALADAVDQPASPSQPPTVSPSPTHSGAPPASSTTPVLGTSTSHPSGQAGPSKPHRVLVVPAPSTASTAAPQPSQASTPSTTTPTTPTPSPSSSPSDTPTGTPTGSESDSPSPTPTPSPTDSDSPPPPICTNFDIDCWWVPPFG